MGVQVPLAAPTKMEIVLSTMEIREIFDKVIEEKYNVKILGVFYKEHSSKAETDK